MMSCDYMLRDDVYESYLLDRLSPAEKSAFEIHLQSCDVCTERLESEKILISGLRQAGREELRLEIQRQAELYHSGIGKQDWTIIMKVAAVIFFLVIMPGALYLFNFEYNIAQYSEQDSGVKDELLNKQILLAPPAGNLESEISSEKIPTGAGNESLASPSETSRPSAAVQKSSASKRKRSVPDLKADQPARLMLPGTDNDKIEQPVIDVLDEQNRMQEQSELVHPASRNDIRINSGSVPETGRNKLSVSPGVIDIKTASIPEFQGIPVLADRKSGEIRHLLKVTPFLAFSENQETKSFPDSFRVEIVHSDSVVIKMQWYLEPDNPLLQLKSVSFIKDEQLLRLNFSDTLEYIINLSAGEQKAIRQKIH